jgi:hypothetical protein
MAQVITECTAVQVCKHSQNWPQYTVPIYSIIVALLDQSWTPKGYSSPRQSDWALFTLGINLAKSAPLCTGKKAANHSP